MNKLEYLRGDDLVLENGLEFKHPSLGDLTTDETSYYFYSLANLFASRSIDNIGLLVVEAKIENPFQFEDYNLFLNFYNSSKELYDKCFEFICGVSDFEIFKHNETDEMMLYSRDKNVYINKESYEKIKKFYIFILHIKQDQLYNNLKGGRAMKMVIDNEVYDYKKKKEKSKKVKKKKNDSKEEQYDYLCNQISALISMSNYNINYTNVFDLKLYQFHDLIKNYSNQLNYRNVMNGYYMGKIDPKKIDLKKINWIIQE